MSDGMVAEQGARKSTTRQILGCLAAVALASICLCGALAVAGGVWLKSQDHDYPTDPVALAQVVQAEVAEMRGLEFKHPVTVTLLSPEELRTRVMADFEKDWSPEEARDFTLVLRAFDMIDSDLDLYQMYVDLYSEQIAGFYDPETKELYVISGNDQVGVMERLTMAHELTHALQDQHYDLGALGYSDALSETHDSEYMAGLQGLTEGDASHLEVLYMRTLSPLDWVRLVWEYAQVDTDQYNSLPSALREQFEFPYEQGAIFVQGLYESRGQDAVDAAFANPPQSTEQILHLDRYLAGDTPIEVALPPLTDTLGSGWRLADEDIMGESFIRYHLSEELTDTVERAAEGWGGDRFAIYDQGEGGSSVLLWSSIWDNSIEAREFVKHYQLYLTRRVGGTADEGLVPGWSCWNNSEDYRCLKYQDETVTLVRAPEGGLIKRVLQQLDTP